MGDKRATAKAVIRPNPPCKLCGEETGMMRLVPPGTMKKPTTSYWCEGCQIWWKVKGANHD
jgi:hypothetical protein